MTGGKRGAEAAEGDGRPISKRRCDGLQGSPRRRASVRGGGGSGSGSGTFNVGVANEPRVSIRLEGETERQMNLFANVLFMRRVDFAVWHA